MTRLIRALRRVRSQASEPIKPPEHPPRERRRIILEIEVEGEPHEADLICERIKYQIRPWKLLMDATRDFPRRSSIHMRRE